MGHSKSSTKRKYDNITGSPQETGKREREKQQQTKPKVNRRKEIIKIRAEINEVESKKTNTKDQ